MKKVFACFLLILLLVSLLIPIGAEGKEASSEQKADSFAIVRDGAAVCKIIRSASGDASIARLAVELRSRIKAATGVSLPLGTDVLPEGAEPDGNTYEILLGPTNRPESETAAADSPYGGYVIAQIGNKLVIHAPDKYGLEAAVDQFLSLLDGYAEKGSLALERGFRFVGSISYEDTPMHVLPRYAGGRIDGVFDAGDGTTMLIVSRTTRQEYAAYRALLEQNGYRLYAENDITDNCFATYINDSHTVTVGFYHYAKSVRIMLEPRRSMPGLPAENIYQTVTEPSLIQLGLEIEGGPQNGMSYLFQLADGSYIVIDGGFYRAEDAEKLMQYMLRNAPDKRNVTIAAWIITHAHGDHTGAFRRFAEKYAGTPAYTLKLERMIAAFLDESYRLVNFTDEGTEMPMMFDCLKKFDGAEFVRAHVGQKYFIRDAEIEILYTIESYMPKELTYFNNSSLVFTLELAGQKFLFTGDASNETMDIVARMYGSYIDSDFVQSAHHGYGGGSNAYYGLIKSYALSSPSVVLWPVGNKDYPGLSRGQLYNTYLVDRLHTVREIIVAGGRDVILKLPYTPGTSGADTILK